jgi:hypothetical protein
MLANGRSAEGPMPLSRRETAVKGDGKELRSGHDP